ncbi:hypothetical protein LTR97_001811 [Elasticomyces elasticus]|uniref:Uncharacterized protein n=1 Tax=Elasticomyces elasticus TaxID=574655 RepID=A0AAN7WGL7_9PEZI|nr:hypothetical protein LTR97_001811 [Elasticomyces elasticus]
MGDDVWTSEHHYQLGVAVKSALEKKPEVRSEREFYELVAADLRKRKGWTRPWSAIRKHVGVLRPDADWDEREYVKQECSRQMRVEEAKSQQTQLRALVQEEEEDAQQPLRARKASAVHSESQVGSAHEHGVTPQDEDERTEAVLSGPTGRQDLGLQLPSEQIYNVEVVMWTGHRTYTAYDPFNPEKARPVIRKLVKDTLLDQRTHFEQPVSDPTYRPRKVSTPEQRSHAVKVWTEGRLYDRLGLKTLEYCEHPTSVEVRWAGWPKGAWEVESPAAADGGAKRKRLDSAVDVRDDAETLRATKRRAIVFRTSDRLARPRTVR